MDSRLRERMIRNIGGAGLYMNNYSARQFVPYLKNIVTDDLFLEKREGNCFVETTDVSPYIAYFSRLVIYRWNRAYPGDLYFPTEVLSDGFKLIGSTDFAGSSHQCITEEVYERIAK